MKNKEKILYRGMDFYKGTIGGFLNEVFGVVDDSFDAPKVVVTPNPEMVVEMESNNDFAMVLRSADYRLVDGYGLWFGLRYLWGEKNLHRICGSDLLQEILDRNKVGGFKIFLLGAKPGVALKISEMYPDANIVGVDAPKFSVKESEMELVIQKIVNSEADMVFVAFGAPKQEMWMWKAKDRLSSVKFIFGVGGAFDFIAGEVSRAPVIVRKYVGLEWLYRLLKEPIKRWRRIYRAVVVFPILFVRDLYRRYKKN